MAMVEDLNGQSFDTVLFFSPASAKQKLQQRLTNTFGMLAVTLLAAIQNISKRKVG